MRRVLDFRPLGRALELAERTALCAPTASGRGHAREVVPYRRRELLRRLREANRRSSAGRPWTRAPPHALPARPRASRARSGAVANPRAPHWNAEPTGHQAP
ncbi:hypothetical protein GCM10010214_30480 [Streptomyces abikoensis]|nr:hypothetical protein GCM10010214_30480 [Streptomyces abikoensis]